MEDLQFFITATKGMKEEDWEDLDPILHIFHEDGQNHIILLVGLPGGPVLWQAIVETVIKFRISHGPVAGVAFITDARMRAMLPNSVRPPDDNLQEKWEAGDRDGITETMVICVVNRDGSWHHATLPYDAASQTWLDPVLMSSTDAGAADVGGGVFDALMASVADTQPDGTKIQGSEMVDLLHQVAKEHPEFVGGTEVLSPDEVFNPNGDRVHLGDYLKE